MEAVVHASFDLAFGCHGFGLFVGEYLEHEGFW